MKNKIKIIYIAGMGHSGTTLLDLILSSASNAFSVGEIKYLKNFILKEKYKKNPGIENEITDETLKTGKKFEESIFWKDIIKKINPEKLYQRKLKGGIFEKIKETSKIIFNIPIKSTINKESELALFENIIKRAQEINQNEPIEYIIDSSKDLRRLVNLKEILELDLKVLYLIRDSRGVINSYSKFGRYFIATFSRWVLQNILYKLYIKRNFNKKDFYILSYDQFCQSPDKFIKEIKDKFNLNLDVKNYIEKINQKDSYRFAGNKMRNKKLEAIKQDQSWRSEIKKSKLLIINLLSTIFNKYWVYNENSDK